MPHPVKATVRDYYTCRISEDALPGSEYRVEVVGQLYDGRAVLQIGKGYGKLTGRTFITGPMAPKAARETVH